MGAQQGQRHGQAASAGISNRTFNTTDACEVDCSR